MTEVPRLSEKIFYSGLGGSIIGLFFTFVLLTISRSIKGNLTPNGNWIIYIVVGFSFLGILYGFYDWETDMIKLVKKK